MSADLTQCQGPDCTEVFERTSWNKTYHNIACKRAARRERESEHAIRGLDPNANTSPQNNPPMEQVRWSRGNKVDITAIVGPGEDAVSALQRLLTDTLGEYADAAELLRPGAFTIGRFPGGDMVVWAKNITMDSAALRSQAEKDLAERFVTEIGRRKPRKTKPKAAPATWWWPYADCQVGKGTEETFGQVEDSIARVDWLTDVELPSRFKELPERPSTIVIPLMGDLTEGVTGSYENQAYTVSLNAAEQLEIATSMVDRLVERALDLVDQVIITGVCSNHDQNSRGDTGRNITDAWDDRTFTVLRTLGMAYSKNPERYGDRVFVEMPQQPDVALVECPSSGLVVACTHGHIPRGGGEPVNKLWRWWDGQISGRQPAAAAHVLLAGHYHHSYQLSQCGRTLIGLPSLDGGSAWFSRSSGRWSLPGLTTFTTSHDQGVSNIQTHVAPSDRAIARSIYGTVAA